MATSGVDHVWRTITISDGSPPVGLARLDRDGPTGAFAALVRFPAGWERPTAGRYGVEEELLVLEGDFRMSAVAYRSGDYALFPAGYVRSRSAAPRGAVCLAFFGGPADWTRVPEQEPPTAPVRPLPWRRVLPRSSPVAAPARPLREHDGGSTWLVDGTFGARAPRGARLQLFSLPARSWAIVEPGGRIPPMPMPCLCRLRAVGHADGAGAGGVDHDLSDI